MLHMSEELLDANAAQRRYWNTVAGPRWVAAPGVRERRNQESTALLLARLGTVLSIPDHAQGAAIGGGGLWIARSDWNWGRLDRLDPVTGAPQRRYEIAPGTEGIAFGNAGRLWAVSEAGSRHIYDHPFLGLFQPFFPLVFALDLSRLE
jgi:hypothetical protein